MKKPPLSQFDAISQSARERIYSKVIEHYKKHPGSPWSGKGLVELERSIKTFYASLGEEYKGAFRATLPDFMQQFYDRAKTEIRQAGLYKAAIGDPDPKRIQYFLNSAFEQVAMKTDKMAFDNIRDLRKLSADVFREMSVTGGTRREISRRLLDRALELRGFEFIDNSGSKWPLKSYFDTLARTELMNAGRASYDDKMAGEGFDVMKLSTSGHSCPKCARFEGKLFSLTGATPGLPTKADLEAAGVFHPNCTHSYSLVPDFIRERDYNPDGTRKVGNQPLPKSAIQDTPKHTVVHGKDIAGKFKYKDNGIPQINQVISEQGFDGSPRIVDEAEFEKLMKDSPFVAQRTYGAPDMNTLDSYRNQLYGDHKAGWYLDCSEGGAQYGEGMYCAADYAKSKGIPGIEAEMSHYQALFKNRGHKFAYTETMALDKSAKIYKLNYDTDMDSLYESFLKKYGSEKDRDEYARYKKADNDIFDCAEYCNKFNKGKRKKDQIDFVTELERRKNIVREMKKNFSVLHRDASSYLAEMGYDAINAEGHGASGSYTIVLNRTKLIIKKDSKGVIKL